MEFPKDIGAQNADVQHDVSSVNIFTFNIFNADQSLQNLETSSMFMLLTNILSFIFAPFIFLYLLLLMKRINDWPRGRRVCTSKTMLHGKTAIVTGRIQWTSSLQFV